MQSTRSDEKWELPQKLVYNMTLQDQVEDATAGSYAVEELHRLFGPKRTLRELHRFWAAWVDVQKCLSCCKARRYACSGFIIPKKCTKTFQLLQTLRDAVANSMLKATPCVF